jgi:hypothetical protein
VPRIEQEIRIAKIGGVNKMKKTIVGLLICTLVIFSGFSIVTAGEENTPPDIPSDPHPLDGAVDIGKKTHLSWTSCDPDPGDKAVYDLYFGTDSIPGLIASDLQMPNYNPDALESFTHYYWYVVAKDENGASTTGPVWAFTTNDCDCDPPNQPSGPARVRNRHRYEYNTKTKMQNQGGYYYNFSWGDGTHSGWKGPYEHNERVRAEHQWEEPGTYQVQARYRFQNGGREEYETGWSEPLIVTVTADDPTNNQPDKPTILGPKSGSPNIEYDYTFEAVDLDGDDVYVYVEFCGGCQEAQWHGPYSSGEVFVLTHAWETKGTFTIKAKAKDVYEEESDWTEFDVTMPRSRNINSLFQNFLDSHPYLARLMQRIMLRLGL